LTVPRDKRAAITLQSAVVIYAPLLLGFTLLLHWLAHALNRTFSVFGPGADLEDMTANLFLMIGLIPVQLLSSYDLIGRRSLWVRIGGACVGSTLLAAALERVSGAAWRDEAALILLPWVAGLSAGSCLFSIALVVGRRSAARRRLQRTVRRVVGLVRGSRNVVPVFLAGFMLTIFSPDITKAVAMVPGEAILNVSLGAVALAAFMHDRDDHAYGERIVAMGSLWLLLALSVLLLDVYLISNSQLIDWGASAWTSCGSPGAVAGSSAGCVEVLLEPRLKIAGLLAALGSVSVVAQSLVPPIPRPES
jgi:hypothetical protein